MKKAKNLIIAAIAVLAILSIASCKKSSDGSTAKTSALLSGKWTLRKSEKQQKDGTWLEIAHYDPTTLEFHDDKTVTMMAGSATVTKTWRVSDDQSQLTFTSASGGGDTYDIAQLTTSILQFSPTGYSANDYAHQRDTYTH
jgi:maltose-binding protein MalE